MPGLSLENNKCELIFMLAQGGIPKLMFCHIKIISSWINISLRLKEWMKLSSCSVGRVPECKYWVQLEPICLTF
jgi:hypothetical protein